MDGSRYRREYYLEQQTPMLHFQHEQAGATLRASEVKPKLDRFLIKQFGGAKAMRADSVMRKWFLGDHDALNYKMSIRALGLPKKSTETEDAITSLKVSGKVTSKDVPIRVPIAKSYFGNMVLLDRSMNTKEKIEAVKRVYKDTVFYPDGLALTIFCFDASLQQTIAKYIIPFFLMHNFGTRSNKGFGSYMVKKCDGVEVKYDSEDMLKDYSDSPVFRVYTRTRDHQALMNYANELYKLMKSGVNQQGDYFRSYLFQYMHNAPEPIGNEKAWLKSSGIAPTVGMDKNRGRHEHDLSSTSKQRFRYVRAMFGVGDSLSFVNRVDPATGRPDVNTGKTKVSIKRIENGKPVENFRFASPILFKILDGTLYILSFPVNQDVFNKEFSFSSGKVNGTLVTPEQFDTSNFLSCFASYINDDCAPGKYDSSKRLSAASSIKFRGTIREV